MDMLRVLTNKLRHGGCPPRALLAIEGLASEALRRDPSFFNVLSNYARITNRAIDSQREAILFLIKGYLLSYVLTFLLSYLYVH